MSSPVKITAANVGDRWTYDAAQVFCIQYVGADGVKVKDVNHAVTTRALMSVERLEMLFACGRAEWGDCMEERDSIVKAGW